MRLPLLFLLSFLAFSMYSQDKATISGYIKDAKNGESLIGATVYKQGSNVGTAANEYGFYSLTLPKGEHVVAVSLIGYKTYTFSVNLDKNIINKTDDKIDKINRYVSLGA